MTKECTVALNLEGYVLPVFLYDIKKLHEADFNRPKLSILLIL